jgi:hypothetical protein
MQSKYTNQRRKCSAELVLSGEGTITEFELLHCQRHFLIQQSMILHENDLIPMTLKVTGLKGESYCQTYGPDNNRKHFGPIAKAQHWLFASKTPGTNTTDKTPPLWRETNQLNRMIRHTKWHENHQEFGLKICYKLNNN